MNNQEKDIIKFLDINLEDLEVYATQNSSFYRPKGNNHVSYKGHDLILKVKNTGDVLTIVNGARPGSNGEYSIHSFVFADGTVMGIDEFFSWAGQIKITGTTDADDELNAATVDSFLDGGLGNDRIWGNIGHDHIKGGTGNDYISGGAGNDYIDGGAGDDILTGGAGSDTYIFGVGSGHDLIDNFGNLNVNYDVLKLVDLTRDDIDVSLNYESFAANFDAIDLIITIKSTGETITIKRGFQPQARYNPYGAINVVFGDGTEAILNNLFDPNWPVLNFNGTASDDTIFGSSENDVINSGSGNDLIFGGDGDDVIYGGQGNDIIHCGFGNDTIYGGDGDDIIYTTSSLHFTNENGNLKVAVRDGFDNIYGGVGNDVIYIGGGDRVDGGEGDDTIYLSMDYYNAVIDGGSGNDTFTFMRPWEKNNFYDDEYHSYYGVQATPPLEEGPATFIFGRGSGHDKITNCSVTYVAKDSADIWIQLADLNQGDIEFILEYNRTLVDPLISAREIYGHNLIIRIKDTGETFTINDFIVGTVHSALTSSSWMGYQTFSHLKFADGSIWTFKKIQPLLSTSYETGMGDVVFDNMICGNLVQKAIFRGLTRDEVTLRSEDENLLVTIKATGETWTFLNWTVSESRDYSTKVGYDGIQSFVFADGQTISREGLIEELSTLIGTDGNDELWAVPINDSQLYGGAGDDILHGGLGNDILDGGAGNDTLIGGVNMNGSLTTFVFGRGYGHDQVLSSDSRNILRLIGLSLNDIEVVVESDKPSNGWHQSCMIRIKDTQETIGGISAGSIGQIELGDGTLIKPDALFNQKHLIEYGTEGDDRLEALAGKKAHLVGGEGNDYLIGGENDDILDGGAGNDNLVGRGGNDTFIFGLGYGHDEVYANEQNPDKRNLVRLLGLSFDEVSFSAVYVSSEVYDLVITIKATGETLTIKNGLMVDPSIFNPNGVQSFEFSDGTVISLDQIRDQSWFKESDDPMHLQAGDEGETLVGGSGNDQIFGGAGDDTLNGRGGVDFIDAGAGNDTIDGGADDDIVNGGEGDDTVTGGSGNDVVIGGAGSDSLTGGDGDDIIIGDGADIYYDEDGRASFESQWFSPWNDGPQPGDDLLIGGAGNDILIGGTGSDTLLGGEGDDILIADGGSIGYDWEGNLQVTPHFNDQEKGGNDILDGGAGDDIIYLGGKGTKTVVFGRGYGHDVVMGSQSGLSGPKARIRFLDLTLEDLTLARGERGMYGYNIIITIKDTGETLTLEDTFQTSQGQGGMDSHIAGLDLADGFVSWPELMDQHPEFLEFVGTDEDDYCYLQDLGVTFHGLAGNDTIYAGGGHNKIYGDEGDDTLCGGYERDELYGGDGNDILDGGDGNNLLSGGRGNDVFIVNQGHNTIDAYDLNQTKNDIVKLGWYTDPANIIYTIELNNGTGLYDLILLDPDSGRSMRLLSAVSPNQGVFNPYGIQAIEFANGATKTWAEIYDPAWFNGLPGGGRLIVARPSGGEVHGTAGNDIIYGLIGDDFIFGGAGDDLLISGQGNNTLNGGSGNDTLKMSTGSSNTIVFGRGYGNDVLVEDEYAYQYQARVSLVGLGRNEVSYSFMDAGDGFKSLVITIKNTSETLTLTKSHQSYGDRPQDQVSAYFEGIEFQDGFLDWNGLCLDQGWIQTINGDDSDDNLSADYRSGGALIDGRAGNDQLNGGSGQDVLIGGDGDDELWGNDGNDQIFGGTGNDILCGGTGDDYLEGGTGDDTYVFYPWDAGSDVINNQGGGLDRLLVEYANPTDMWFSRDGSHLLIGLIGGGQITVNNWFDGGDNRLEAIMTSDYSLAEDQVAQMVQAMASIGAPAGSWGQWTDEQQQALEPLVAAHWQSRF